MARRKQEADEPQFLYVRSARDDDRVALHEIDDAHPFGSVMVAGDVVHKVANTAFVQAQLRAGELEEVKSAKDRSAADKWHDERVKAFQDAGMLPPSTVAGDVPHVDEGRDPEAEAEASGELGGGLSDPSRGGTGSAPTAEEEAAAGEGR